MLKRFAVIGGVLLLGACSSITNWMEGKVEYKTATALPPLEIPPDLTSPARDNRYVVPDAAKSTATLSGYEAERREGKPAAGLVVLPQVDRMRVERAGTQRWLVVEESPEKLWPLVREFWQENGFLIKLEAADLGVMETEWAESRAKLPQGGVSEPMTTPERVPVRTYLLTLRCAVRWNSRRRKPTARHTRKRCCCG